MDVVEPGSQLLNFFSDACRLRYIAHLFSLLLTGFSQLTLSSPLLTAGLHLCTSIFGSSSSSLYSDVRPPLWIRPESNRSAAGRAPAMSAFPGSSSGLFRQSPASLHGSMSQGNAVHLQLSQHEGCPGQVQTAGSDPASCRR